MGPALGSLSGLRCLSVWHMLLSLLGFVYCERGVETDRHCEFIRLGLKLYQVLLQVQTLSG